MIAKNRKGRKEYRKYLAFLAILFRELRVFPFVNFVTKKRFDS